MNDSPIRSLVRVLIFTLLILFPFTSMGERTINQLFPSVNFGESSIIPAPAPNPTPEDLPSPEPAEPPVLSDYYTVCRAELSGSYKLVSIRTDTDEFSDELLLQLQQRGVPLTLDLSDDGSGLLRIFDRAETLLCDADSMLLRFQGETLPFFYLNGQLRVQDGDRYMVFQKLT